MKIIRVYDRRGRLLREFSDVAHSFVGMNGALVVNLPQRPGQPTTVVIAPGQWHNLEEWNDTPPDTALEARPAGELPPVPPPYDPNQTDIGIVRRPQNEARFPQPNRPYPDPGATAIHDTIADSLTARAARAAQFFSVICTCASLRCPVEIDPPAMPGWLQQKQQTAPRQQCSWEIGHDATVTPHAWELHGWPYGINEHHPKCPRFPGNRDTVSADVYATDLQTRAQLAVDMLNTAGHPTAATNLAAAYTYSRETDSEVTGAPIPDHVEGHHIGERTVPVIPGQRQPGTMPGEG